jgi:hypothetical protein
MFLSYNYVVLVLALFSLLVCMLLLRLCSCVRVLAPFTLVLILITCLRRERLQFVNIPHKRDCYKKEYCGTQSSLIF